jgi:hypothetical protein
MDLRPRRPLHIVFVWREGKANGSNHDINYAYSDDNGVSWKNNAGQLIADTRAGGWQRGAEAHHNRFSWIGRAVVADHEFAYEYAGAGGGQRGAIHALMWHRDSGKPQAAGEVWDTVGSSYFHYWRDDSGTWQRSVIPSKPGAPIGCRPRLLFDKDDNAIAVYTLRSGRDAGTTAFTQRGRSRHRHRVGEIEVDGLGGRARRARTVCQRAAGRSVQPH